MDEIDRLLRRVKDRARGWMPAAVYRRLYESAAACGGGTIVEIGTFCGAATIALALGARDAGRPFQVVTADILRPGHEPPGESDVAKAALLRATFAEFGVGDEIRFVHGDARALVAIADPQDVGLLLLDGGGRIESDLALLWNRLSPGAAVVIDDVDGRVSVQRSLRSALVNQKHVISRLLADAFVEAGVLAPEDRLASTGWYRKGDASLTPDEIRLMALPAYHQLIRVRVESHEFGLARSLARRLARKAPWLRRVYRMVWPAP